MGERGPSWGQGGKGGRGGRGASIGGWGGGTATASQLQPQWAEGVQGEVGREEELGLHKLR
jgi:hypothetical protein